MTIRKRLGEQLIEAGLLTPMKLEAALSIQRAEGGYLSDVLVVGGFVEEQVLLAKLAAGGNRRFVTSERLSRLALTPEALAAIPLDQAERLCVMPLALDAGTATLRVAVPEIEEPYLSWVKEAARSCTNVVPMLAVRAVIRAAIARHYHGDLYAFSALLQISVPAQIGVDQQTQVVARTSRPTLARIDITPAPAEVPRSEDAGTEPFVMVPPDLLTSEGVAAEDKDQGSARFRLELADKSRKIQMLQVANSLGGHLARERDLSVLLHRLLAFACDTLPVDDGVVLWSDEKGELQPRAVRSKTRDTVIVSKTLIGEVFKSQQAVLTVDAASDPRFNKADSIIITGLRSAMGVPLVVSGKVLGMLCLSTRGKGLTLGPLDLTLLSGIAAQASTSIENAILNQRVQSDATSRAHLARFFSPALVELAASGALAVGGKAEAQDATILFADIRGFSAMSERLQPGEVVDLLNEHFEAMVEIIFSNGGVLDKFIGDALMALWGVPIRQPDEPVRALKAANEMLLRVKEMNVRRKARGAECFEIGIGVNTGAVVFGAIGASRRLELTAIGDAVNVAARLSQLAAPGHVLISEATAGLTSRQFESAPMPPVTMKGKSHPVRVFEVTKERASAPRSAPPKPTRKSPSRG